MLLTAFHLCPNQRSEATNTNQTSSAGIHQDRTLDAHTNTFSGAPLGTAEAFKWGFGEPMLQDATRHKYLEAAQSNGIHRKLSGDQSAADSAFPSQLSTPSSRSLSPTRCTPNPTFLINALHFLSLPWPTLSLQAPQRTRLWFKVQLIWTRCTACFRAQLKRHVEAGISYLLLSVIAIYFYSLLMKLFPSTGSSC